LRSFAALRIFLCFGLRLWISFRVHRIGRAVMKVRLIVSSFALLALAALGLYCNPAPTHQLQSITLTPASADGQNYANGQVQFVATGHYNVDPLTVTPLPATWGTCTQQFAATTAVSVTQNGLAQCTSGGAGTYTVWANDPITELPGQVYSCPAQGACGGGCVIQANAQLTCP